MGAGDVVIKNLVAPKEQKRAPANVSACLSLAFLSPWQGATQPVRMSIYQKVSCRQKLEITDLIHIRIINYVTQQSRSRGSDLVKLR